VSTENASMATAQSPLPPTAPRPRVTTGHGTPAEKSWNLRRPVTLIGSRRSAQILLRHPEVSKAHCAVINTGRHVLARDLNSRTGTRLKGEAIHLAVVHDGDMMNVGPVNVEFAIQAGSPGDAGDPLQVPFVASIRRTDSSEQWEIRSAATLIGRKAGGDIVLDHADISLAHALLCHVDGSLAIFDLGSRTGTWLNGQQVQYAQLRSEDSLRIGPFELAVVLAETPVVEGQQGDPRHIESVTNPPVPVDYQGGIDISEPTDISEPIEDDAVPFEDLPRGHESAMSTPEIVINQPARSPEGSDTAGPDAWTEAAGGPETLLSDLERNLAVLQKNLSQSAQRVSRWQAQLDARSSELDRREAELNAREAPLRDLEQQLSQKQTELDQVLSTVQQRQTQIEAAEKTIAEQGQQLQAAQQEFEQRRNTTLGEIQQQQQQLAQLQSEVTAKAQELGAQADRIENQRHEVESRQQQVESALAAIEAQKQSVQSAAEELRKGQESLSANASRLEQERSEFAGQKTAAEEQLRQKASEFDAKDTELKQRSDALMAAIAQHEEDKKAQAAQRQEMEEAAVEMEQYAEQLEQRTAAIEQRTAELDSRTTQLDQREEEIGRQEQLLQQQASKVKKDLAAIHKQAALIQQIHSALAQANAVFSSDESGDLTAGLNDAMASAGLPHLSTPLTSTEPEAPESHERGSAEEPPAPQRPHREETPRTAARSSQSASRVAADHAAAKTPKAAPMVERPAAPAPRPANENASPKPASPSPVKSPAQALDAETVENIRMLRRLGAKGTDEELLAHLHAKQKDKPPPAEENQPSAKKRWWSR